MSECLCMAQCFGRVVDFSLKRDQFRQFAKIEQIDARKFLYSLKRPSTLERCVHIIDAFRVGAYQFRLNGGIVFCIECLLLRLKAEAEVPSLKGTDCLLERLVEVATDCHRLADRLHLRS